MFGRSFHSTRKSTKGTSFLRLASGVLTLVTWSKLAGKTSEGVCPTKRVDLGVRGSMEAAGPRNTEPGGVAWTSYDEVYMLHRGGGCPQKSDTWCQDIFLAEAFSARRMLLRFVFCLGGFGWEYPWFLRGYTKGDTLFLLSPMWGAIKLGLLTSSPWGLVTTREILFECFCLFFTLLKPLNIIYSVAKEAKKKRLLFP